MTLINIFFLLELIILFVTAISLEIKNKTKFLKTNKFEFKGITFVGDKYCPEVIFEDPLSSESMLRLKDTGANWVAVVITEYQDKVNSTDIYPLYNNDFIVNDYYVYKTESVAGLVKIIEYAHSIGLKVMLKPHIDLAREPAYNLTWRGNIGRNFTSKEEWDKWFQSYEVFILKYAEMAQLLNVEMFSVSCELIETSKMDTHWRLIISNIRNVYKGLLTDSANHDGEEYDKLWWDELDYIGVDAYYLPIQTEALQKVVLNYTEILELKLKKLKSLSEKFKKDVIITEIGFCSGNCTIGQRDFPPSLIDHKIQAYFYESLIIIFSKHSFIKGIFWWAWNSDPNYGGRDDNCISPQYKYAEFILRNYYEGDTKNMSYISEGAPKCKCTI